MERFFPYEFDERLRIFWWPFGIRSAKDGVRVDDERFEATFGRLRLRTARSNVALTVTVADPDGLAELLG